MRRSYNKNHIIILFLSIMAVIAVFAYVGLNKATINDMMPIIESWGNYAPLIFFLACIGRSIVVLPCGIFSVLGGMLFGPLMGTAIVLMGFTAGSVITFFMARYLGGRWVERILGERFSRVDELVSKNGFHSVFLMRVVPILPFDVVSCIAGISKVKLIEYVAATFLGSIPGVFVYVYFGDSIVSLSFKKVVFALVLTAAFAAAPFIYSLAVKLLQKSTS